MIYFFIRDLHEKKLCKQLRLHSQPNKLLSNPVMILFYALLKTNHKNMLYRKVQFGLRHLTQYIL
jgi:hypothetical protein